MQSFSIYTLQVRLASRNARLVKTKIGLIHAKKKILQSRKAKITENREQAKCKQ